MWRHIEPERLHQTANGVRLLDSECEHLVSCALCHELLILFEKLTHVTEPGQAQAA
jgi:hypothetical protein